MSTNFKEIDCQPTPLGELSLRKRKLLQLNGREVFEIKLNEEYLMSSLFHEVEIALAKHGLHRLEESRLDVVVGGLGLGYTAMAALKDSRVQSLLVVEFLKPVIQWHEQHLVPLGKGLTEDKRCRFVHRDFFATARSSEGFDPDHPGKKFHAILLDIDHSPSKHLHSNHQTFYTPESLKSLAQHVIPNGVFALWSDDPPEEGFKCLLSEVFGECDTDVIEFKNPLTLGASANTLYIAKNLLA